jgi:threonylcarbamoyladenosine tRNA methylthiotransferase MtaB
MCFCLGTRHACSSPSAHLSDCVSDGSRLLQISLGATRFELAHTDSLAATRELSYNPLLDMATFHIINFGCRASQADGSALKQQLLKAGLQEAASGDESQVVILNTCTVTATADAEARQIVRSIHRRNPDCRILVTGCYAQRAPGEVARLEGVAWVVGNSHKHLVSAILAAGSTAKSGDRVIGRSGEQQENDREIARFHLRSATPFVQVQAVAIGDPAPDSGPASPQPPVPSTQSRPSDPVQVLVGEITEEFHFAPVFPDDRTRPTLKIQDGCNARCSFCVIPSVRGRSRSLAPEKVLGEVRHLEEAGYHEIVLSGINLGSYGRDLDRRTSFLGILERILRETAIARIRISSIEPMDVSPALIRFVAQEPRLAQHFHVPLQSGCDRILRLMNRRYWARQYAERILAVREQIPNCGIGADVMVGFPGETDQDHSASVRFIASLPFTYLHIFPYSARPGTPAAAAKAQINGRVARERSQEIRAAIAAKRQAFLAAQAGQSIPGLTLDEVEDGARVALTTNYLKVALPGSDARANQLVDVWVGRASSGQLFGYPRAVSMGSAALSSAT